MKVTFVCPACRDTINAPPSLEGEAYPCPKCRAAVECWPAPINPPASAPASPAAPAAPGSPTSVRIVPPPPEPAVWHYSVNGARRGPVTFGQLKSLVESAVLRPTDLLWREGMPTWVEAGTVPDLFPAGALAKPAPPPFPLPEDAAGEGSGNGRPILVNVTQVVEREEERRPRRRRYRCPYCDCPARPYFRQQIAAGGWTMFGILMVLTFFLFLGVVGGAPPGVAVLMIITLVLSLVGLAITEEVVICPDCRRRV